MAVRGSLAAAFVLSWSLAPAALAAGPKAPEAQQRAQWQKDIAKTRLPAKKGCFTAKYPDKTWKEVACGAPSRHPNDPASGAPPATIGNGNDISTHVSGALLISSAVGSFDSVTPSNLTETGLWAGSPKADAFSLQINTQLFPTSLCGGVCQGWQQFIYSQNQCGNPPSPCVFIEYWLVNNGPSCPPGPWIQLGTTGHCYYNSPSTIASGALTAAQLAGTTLTAMAASGGDTVIVTSPNGTATAMATPSVFNLDQVWNTAEWNVFGDCCSSQADFSAGTTIVPRLTINDGTAAAPECSAAGFTGERNNLSLGPAAPAASGVGPSLIFTESSAGGLIGCAAATSVGDTHLTTFGGTLYDFQASGDVILAQTVNPDFAVQARQVSGAPNWPSATVNKAVAARMGKTRVAVCLPPAGIAVDGKPAQLEDGKRLDFAGGASVMRQGNTYLIRDASGDSVRAEVNDSYINVWVGLGRWPASVHGVLANNAGNSNEIAARDGAALAAPFAFDELYGHYADSWRVHREESLLSPCGEAKEEPGVPGKPFFAKDLPAKLQRAALEACQAAGVKIKPLLDACVLDVAVIGHKGAAKVYAGVKAPRVVGDAGPRRGHKGDGDHDGDDKRKKE